MYYHYIFKTYKCKPCLLSKEFKNKLGLEFERIAKDKGLELSASSVLEDHVHLLVKQSTTDSTDYVMRMFKGISARRFFQQYPTNRHEYRKLWGRGYYARKLTETELPTVLSYIKGQILSNGLDKRYANIK